MAPHEPRVEAIAPGSLVDLLTSNQRAMTRGLAALFEDEGVSVDQWRVMRTVAGGGRPMGELATVLEIPHPTLTRLIDALAEVAFVYRAQSAHDRRRVDVHLSTLGERALHRLNAQAQAHEAALRARFGAEAIDELTSALLRCKFGEQRDDPRALNREGAAPLPE